VAGVVQLHQHINCHKHLELIDADVISIDHFAGESAAQYANDLA
jgi:hypothetical protein